SSWLPWCSPGEGAQTLSAHNHKRKNRSRGETSPEAQKQAFLGEPGGGGPGLRGPGPKSPTFPDDFPEDCAWSWRCLRHKKAALTQGFASARDAPLPPGIPSRTMRPLRLPLVAALALLLS